VRQRYTGGDPYFLFVGALHPRKNITGLLRAYDTFRKRSISRIKLLIVGAGMHKTGEMYETYNQMTFKQDVAFTGRVTNEELFQIYGAAFSLVYVPFFEGFGIPILEAMRSGVPVICSDTTSMPEVGGDAVCYVHPDHSEQIAEAMIRIAADPAYRKVLIHKGFEQQNRFSWERSAKLLWVSIEAMMRSTPE
jgi:glycosyltransferase involved in cell wall biosynthesis